jgi:hypothetical protein
VSLVELTILHCKEDPIYEFPEMKLRGLVPNFNIHVSESDSYILTTTYFAATK